MIGESVTEPLDENEVIYAKSASFKDNSDKIRELAELVDYKLETEAEETNIFINMLKDKY